VATFAPEVAYAVEEINDRFPALGPGGTYPNHGEDEPGGLPSEFYSADFWSTDKAVHDKVFAWCIENHERLNLHYIVSWCRIWNVERADEGIRRYFQCEIAGTGASKRHTNHVHITFWEQGFYMPSLSDIRKVIREELKANNDDAARVFLTIDGVLENNMPGASAAGTHASLETFIERIAKAVKA
jgi:hypothetical protein